MFRAFSTLGCPDATLDETLAIARRFGVSAIELRALEGELDLPALFLRRGYSPRTLAEKLYRAGVSVVAFGTSHKLVGAEPGGRDKLLAYVPWAEALGGVRLRVFDGGTNLSDAELTEAREELCWWTALRAANAWRCDWMVETHDTLLNTGALKTFLKWMPQSTQLLWDTHHTWRKGGEHPALTWEVIHPRVVHLHVKDSQQDTSTGAFNYVLPGRGEFPLQDLLASLTTTRYSGALSLEWEKKWHPELPPLDEALSAANAGWW